MRDRNQGASPRTLIGGVLLSAAFLYATWDMTVPACVLYGVIVIATAMLCRAYIARDRAILRADAQQRRADLLAALTPHLDLRAALQRAPRPAHRPHRPRHGDRPSRRPLRLRPPGRRRLRDPHHRSDPRTHPRRARARPARPAVTSLTKGPA
ncbi:hypothetical protein [Actinomadura madurae]|uniref:hypothetical protein n=1 Tax=Actinomadura madurae TaxID=1993 RepID=UPI0020D23225|nr:hypothetical protein [Actinomadura madurae]MCP9947320.1 hypothetical protein [Actinomadura madurae]MCQ0012753.1 hypothetical protein [Actinomadura madurae]